MKRFIKLIFILIASQQGTELCAMSALQSARRVVTHLPVLGDSIGGFSKILNLMTK